MSSDNISFIMLLITLAALASPIITTVINNSHQMELKRLEEIHNNPKKDIAINEYIAAAASFISRCENESCDSVYWEKSALLRLYTSQRTWTYIDAVDKSVLDQDSAKIRMAVLELCKRLKFD